MEGVPAGMGRLGNAVLNDEQAVPAPQEKHNRHQNAWMPVMPLSILWKR